MKRLPTSVIFHPVGQQKSSTLVQVQWFWNSQKPTFDQSVARVWTPVWISLTITFLDSSKSYARSSPQWKQLMLARQFWQLVSAMQGMTGLEVSSMPKRSYSLQGRHPRSAGIKAEVWTTVWPMCPRTDYTDDQG